MIKKSIECWILGSDGTVLLLRVPRREGKNEAFWQPITGGIEGQETASEAAIREIREETGLDVAADSLAVVAEDFRAEISPELTISKTVFSARVTPGEITLSPLEHEAHQWAAPDDVQPQLYWESNRQTWAMVSQHSAADSATP